MHPSVRGIAPATSWKCVYAREMNCGERANIFGIEMNCTWHTLYASANVYRIIRGIRVPSVATSSYQPITVTAIYSLDYLKPHIQYTKSILCTRHEQFRCVVHFSITLHTRPMWPHIRRAVAISGAVKQTISFSQSTVLPYTRALTHYVNFIYIYFISSSTGVSLERQGKIWGADWEQKNDSRWNIVKNTKNFVCNLTAAAAALGFFSFFIIFSQVVYSFLVEVLLSAELLTRNRTNRSESKGKWK